MKTGGHAVLTLKRLLIWVAASVVIGSASAFFLWSLDAVTRIRLGTPSLVYFLPLAGLVIGLVYKHWGETAAAGTNLLLEEIHQPSAGVPRRMAPLILFGTLLTHLCGGSAGREGTAVQMGGGIAGAFAQLFQLEAHEVKVMLRVGIAAGFGSVFGTPLAGAIFALEVLAVGRVHLKALLPCLLAAYLADWVCHTWGIKHDSYAVSNVALDWMLLAKILLASVCFGLVARGFVVASHRLSGGFKFVIKRPELRPAVGGYLVLISLWICGSSDYLGLGVLPSQPSSVTLSTLFTELPISNAVWLWKLVFTVVTLSSGLKGGEVTPLFFIGAALGNSLAGALGAPVDLMASLGLLAIFAGASKTPIATTLLGVELFGFQNAIYMIIACFVAYYCSGRKGIYQAPNLVTEAIK